MSRILVASLLIPLAVTAAASLTLTDSVGLALKQNPSVVASQKKAAAAEAKLNQAVGAFFPTVKIDGNYGKAYTQPSTMQITSQTTMGSVTQNLVFGTDDVMTTAGLTASLSQPLFVAALFPGYGIAKRGADLARQELRRTVIDASYNVTQAYFGLLAAQKMARLAEESQQMALSHQKQVQAMLKAGVVTKADLLRTDVQVANSEVTLTQAKNGVELAKDALNNALGNDLENPVTVQEEGFTGKVASLPAYKELLNQAYANRPDWEQFQLSTAISEDTVKVYQAEYLPTVLLSASTGKTITEYPTFRSDVNSWRVTGAGSWTLFDGLGRENRIKEAAANLDAQRATEEQIRNGIALEVRDALLSLKATLDTIGSTQKAVDSAQESYHVSSTRYQSGVGTNLEVIDAQVALNQARVNNLQALFNVEIAKAKINKVVGKEVL
ncbi:MAG: TolC family protein [Candidatus Margulisbacteria bacterium]|nr:TolC family protein [Candidatus Margulisiibacteriota bacterium]